MVILTKGATKHIATTQVERQKLWLQNKSYHNENFWGGVSSYKTKNELLKDDLLIVDTEIQKIKDCLELKFQDMKWLKRYILDLTNDPDPVSVFVQDYKDLLTAPTLDSTIRKIKQVIQWKKTIKPTIMP